ncbi:MAG: division/cell wall cluster transcriptional repressor MraZ [Clostridiaceae bacterium]|nr:division/cell wall cluster transcriptional repressor MraZ [Clostridiaceae bacterium]
MFYGEYQHSVDVKGRVIVPSKFRDGLGEKFIITKGLENCLFAYSSEEWANLEAKIKSLPFTDKDVRAFVRFFFAGASECEVDKQGRILVPQNLRDYAGLEKDVYIIGVSNRVEVWDKNKWENYFEDENMSTDKIAEKMSMLGI